MRWHDYAEAVAAVYQFVHSGNRLSCVIAIPFHSEDSIAQTAVPRIKFGDKPKMPTHETDVSVEPGIGQAANKQFALTRSEKIITLKYSRSAI